MNITRRDTIVLGAAAAALGLAGAGTAHAAEGDTVSMDALMAPAGGLTDHALGDEAATVTVIEYASPTCPHCASFQPVLSAWTRKLPADVRLTYVPAAFGPGETWARAFFVAEREGAVQRTHQALYDSASACPGPRPWWSTASTS